MTVREMWANSGFNLPFEAMIANSDQRLADGLRQWSERSDANRVADVMSVALFDTAAADGRPCYLGANEVRCIANYAMLGLQKFLEAADLLEREEANA